MIVLSRCLLVGFSLSVFFFVMLLSSTSVLVDSGSVEIPDLGIGTAVDLYLLVELGRAEAILAIALIGENGRTSMDESIYLVMGVV